MSERVPDYRLRLFVSADIAGSTAFKAAADSAHAAEKEPRPQWVDVFSTFYSTFPRILKEKYQKGGAVEGDEECEIYPKIWKTIGDEVILCSRVLSVEHVARCADVFLDALNSYSEILKKTSLALDLKGSMWVAAFPVPNVGIPIRADVELEDLDTSEAFEARVDSEPSRFDFLGKSIDTGFRVASFSEPTKCPVSVQLAMILAQAKTKTKTKFPHEIWYHGKHSMKGVNSGVEYPIFYLNTENNEQRKLAENKERLMLGMHQLEAQTIVDFLLPFMEVTGIERPAIPVTTNEACPEMPISYVNFVKAYERVRREQEHQTKSLENALIQKEETASNGTDWLRVLSAYTELLKNGKT